MELKFNKRVAAVVAAVSVVGQPGGVKRVAHAVADSVRNNRRMTAVLLTMGTVPAFAAGEMDVAEPLAYIAAALVAKNLIGPAWTGLKYVGKAWNKI